jgi:hypothetical protein
MSKGTVCLALTLLVFSTEAQGGEYKPWSLRDHYSFAGDYSVFKFDVQTGEWLVEVSKLGVLVRDAQCEIEYADGRVDRLSSIRAYKDEREDFKGPLGDGTRFRSLFRTAQGLEVDFSVARFKTRPFLMIHVNLTNRGTKPIAIREIRPAVFDAGAVAELGDTVVMNQALTQRRGNFSMMNAGTGAGLVLLSMKQPKMTLGVGVLRSGLLNSYVDLRPAGRSWVGSVRCAYSPTLLIQPNSKVGCDPVWMSLFLNEARQVSQSHTWSELAGMKSVSPDAIPRGWVTVEEGAPVRDLLRVAEAWEGNYLQHVLVPSGWQESPGSLRGHAPDYPKDMGKVARDIIRIGMVPGISFDPLASDSAEGKLTVKASDGSFWLNLGREDARRFAAERVDKLVNQGYQFFVVEPSRIPDDVLQRFNVTREQADLYSMEIFTLAASGYPVVPSPALTLGDDLAQWQNAAETTSFLQAYGVSAGPLRVESESIKDVSRPLAEAINEFGGPIEIVGTPKKNVRAAVGAACCAQEPPQRPRGGGRD